MTPSLVNFLLSLVGGSVVVGLITLGVVFISQKDKIRRNV